MATQVRWGAKLENYKNISKIFENLSQERAFIDSAPEKQEDYENI